MLPFIIKVAKKRAIVWCLPYLNFLYSIEKEGSQLRYARGGAADEILHLSSYTGHASNSYHSSNMKPVISR